RRHLAAPGTDSAGEIRDFRAWGASAESGGPGDDRSPRARDRGPSRGCDRMRFSRDRRGPERALWPDHPPGTPADGGESEERSHQVEGLDLGARDVTPLVERELVDRLVDPGSIRPPAGGHQPGEDLDIED